MKAPLTDQLTSNSVTKNRSGPVDPALVGEPDRAVDGHARKSQQDGKRQPDVNHDAAAGVLPEAPEGASVERTASDSKAARPKGLR